MVVPALSGGDFGKLAFVINNTLLDPSIAYVDTQSVVPSNMWRLVSAPAGATARISVDGGPISTVTLGGGRHGLDPKFTHVALTADSIGTYVVQTGMGGVFGIADPVIVESLPGVSVSAIVPVDIASLPIAGTITSGTIILLSNASYVFPADLTRRRMLAYGGNGALNITEGGVPMFQISTNYQTPSEFKNTATFEILNTDPVNAHSIYWMIETV